ncbi:unnamed protein product [Schistocephalus solidus]|uniref:Uncharacterized protein n=1 Tax=Schistocephalus solidus TaxID=70667 RepID=A0A183SVD4_SCHSO|nr:unnamed protein product [Schistocephalus solidus]
MAGVGDSGVGSSRYPDVGGGLSGGGNDGSGVGSDLRCNQRGCCGREDCCGDLIVYTTYAGVFLIFLGVRRRIKKNAALRAAAEKS